MALTQREKKIAIGVGGTVAALVLWQVIVTPYFNSRDTIQTQIAAAVQTQTDNTLLFEKQTKAKKSWKEITEGGLKADESEAESQTLRSVLQWAQDSGVNLTALKPERSTEVKEFQVISFHVTGNGSTPAIAKLLFAFEKATIPVRIDDMQITPRKEGTDDLQIQLSVSTLCLKSDGVGSSKTASTYGSIGGRSWN